MANTASALQRKLLVVTGKGGVGKTTIAAALGLAAAARGLRTIVVELGDQGRVPALFGDQHGAGTGAEDDDGPAGHELELAENLWSLSIDPDRALLEWLQKLGGRVPGRVLANSGTFQYFAAAAPGAKEMVSMVKVWELTQAERWRKRAARYDLVVLDAPATGHALGLLRSPYTFGAIARVGPVHAQAERVRELLENPLESAYLAVARPTEMAISETLDLSERLREGLGRELEAAVVNATLPRRFSGAELEQIAALDRRSPVRRSAVLSAQAVHERASSEHSHLARLRRHGLAVLTVPFIFSPELDLDDVEQIGARLVKRL